MSPLPHEMDMIGEGRAAAINVMKHSMRTTHRMSCVRVNTPRVCCPPHKKPLQHRLQPTSNFPSSPQHRGRHKKDKRAFLCSHSKSFDRAQKGCPVQPRFFTSSEHNALARPDLQEERSVFCPPSIDLHTRPSLAIKHRKTRNLCGAWLNSRCFSFPWGGMGLNALALPIETGGMVQVAVEECWGDFPN